MKVIDFNTKGNVIKLYFGKDDEKEYLGDDWDDAPYEHNAGTVYNEYVWEIKEYAFPFGYEVLEPASDWHYGGNSPFSKEDMKKRKIPCLIIKQIDENSWSDDYSLLLGSKEKNVLKIYFNDNLKKLEEKLFKFDCYKIAEYYEIDI